MASAVPRWVEPLMRAGFAARGLTYAFVGYFALLAAWYGGKAEGTKGALSKVQSFWWGEAMLVLIAIGLFAYALWRLINSLLDLDQKGTDLKGCWARLGGLSSASVNFSLSAYVAFVLVAEVFQESSGDSGTKSMTAAVMAQPFGRWAVAALGVGIIAYGATTLIKAVRKNYERTLRKTPLTERLAPVMRFGLLARSFVLGLIGCFFIWAAWTYDSSQAGGLGQAFAVVREAMFGRLILAVLAFGMAAFAVYCYIEARYRVIPSAAGEGIETLGRD